MARYRTIAIEIWEDAYIEKLPLDGKLFYVYLITSCRSNLGIIERSIERLCFETGMTAKRIGELLDKLEADGKIARDKGAILVVNFIKHQTSNSPKIIKGLVVEFRNVSSVKLRVKLAAAYPGFFGDEEIPYRYGIEGYSEKNIAYPEMEVEMEVEVERKGNGEGILTAADSPPLEADASATAQTELFEPSCSLEEVAALWNEMMPREGFSAVKMNLLSKDRRKHLRARQRTFPASRDIDFWRKVFTVLLRSSFLRGDKTEWRATFDFCIESDQKLRKIVEGNYDDKCVVETWVPYDEHSVA